ncbi:hypothetical protein P3T73_01515 [Kiritimatiellota bacterium B12222]|nr:hypothetical protein P3T73_01515 [Kiritimatiellota bacterium B12222]
MKSLCILLFLALASPLWSQEPLQPTDDPQTLHQVAMENLQLQADQWTAIAVATRKPKDRELYQEVAQNYVTLIEIRETQFLADQKGEAFHYETLYQHSHRHRVKLAQAEARYAPKEPPQLPPEVTPPAKAEAVAEPPPPPQKSYRTASGFEVKFILEK